jgi:insulin gene enhancer protein ISL-1
MHGYDIPMGNMPHGQQQPQSLAQMTTMDPNIHHNHHPDSTDSYVTYLESDESMQDTP